MAGLKKQEREMPVKILETSKAPKAIGPYSQAVEAGGFIFCSGQVALNPDTGKIEGESAADQAGRVIENLRAVLEAAGVGLDRVVRTTIFLTDMNDFSSVNQVYGSFFKDSPPARATVAVKTLPLDVRVEIDCIAYAGD